MFFPYTTVAFFGVAFAADCAKVQRDAKAKDCLSREDAQQVADNFQSLSSEYFDAMADASTTSDFTYYSDSLISLINSGCSSPMLYGEPVFDSRKALKAGQGAQPTVRFQVTKMWYSCKEVFIYWNMTGESNTKDAPSNQIRGITTIEAEEAAESSPFPWINRRVWSEFNSGAYLVTLGVFQPRCEGARPPGSIRTR